MLVARQTLHLPVVTATRSWRDWFGKRYWVRCWECNEASGPWITLAMAQHRVQDFAMFNCAQDLVPSYKDRSRSTFVEWTA